MAILNPALRVSKGLGWSAHAEVAVTENRGDYLTRFVRGGNRRFLKRNRHPWFDRQVGKNCLAVQMNLQTGTRRHGPLAMQRGGNSSSGDLVLARSAMIPLRSRPPGART